MRRGSLLNAYKSMSAALASWLRSFVMFEGDVYIASSPENQEKVINILKHYHLSMDTIATTPTAREKMIVRDSLDRGHDSLICKTSGRKAKKKSPSRLAKVSQFAFPQKHALNGQPSFVAAAAALLHIKISFELSLISLCQRQVIVSLHCSGQNERSKCWKIGSNCAKH